MQPYRHRRARCSTAPSHASLPATLPPLRPVAVACLLAWMALPPAHATDIGPGDDVQISNPGGITSPLTMTGGQLTTLSTMTLAPALVNFDGSLSQFLTVAAAPGTTLTFAAGVESWVNSPIVRFNRFNQTGTVIWTPGSIAADPTAMIAIEGGVLRYGNANAAALGVQVQLLAIDTNATLHTGNLDTEFKNLQGSGTLDTGSAT